MCTVSTKYAQCPQTIRVRVYVTYTYISGHRIVTTCTCRGVGPLPPHIASHPCARPLQACEQDAKTLQTYVGHPHLHIIDNSTDFAGKINRVVEKMSQLIGVHVPTSGSYSRFLVRNPPMEIPVSHVVVDIDIAILKGSTMHDESRLLLRGDRTGKKFTYIHQKLKRVQGLPRTASLTLERPTTKGEDPPPPPKGPLWEKTI